MTDCSRRYYDIEKNAPLDFAHSPIPRTHFKVYEDAHLFYKMNPNYGTFLDAHRASFMDYEKAKLKHEAEYNYYNCVEQKILSNLLNNHEKNATIFVSKIPCDKCGAYYKAEYVVGGFSIYFLTEDESCLTKYVIT